MLFGGLGKHILDYVYSDAKMIRFPANNPK